MTKPLSFETPQSLLATIATYAQDYRQSPQKLHPATSLEALRERLVIDLPEKTRDPKNVLAELIAGAEPGLVGSSQPGFLAWVIGAAHEAGIGADWLTTTWDQNAGIYQTSPAAAVAEEAVARWLLDILNLPRTASMGITTGATMATFTCLAAARDAVLRRAGCDLSQIGLQGAPEVRIFISTEAHASNFSALRYLGFGEANYCRIQTDVNGTMDVAALEVAIAKTAGPAIILAQAGHIHSGAFDRFADIVRIARTHQAWLHVDGAFGLWARVLPECATLTEGLEQADSWSVDGHKWLQIPYDCGFALVADPEAHRRAMEISASYLPHADDDGRNPTHFGPELARRARGFPVWAVMQSLGRQGIVDMVRAHRTCARHLADRLSKLPDVRIEHEVTLNQVSVSFGAADDDTTTRNARTAEICANLNASGEYFVQTAEWHDHLILRFSFCGAMTQISDVDALADTIAKALVTAG